MSSIEVIATSNPRRLRQLLDRRGLTDSPHICATVSLARQLERIIPTEPLGPHAGVTSIGRLLKDLLPGWFAASSLLRQLTELRRYAGQPSETETDGGREGLRRNLTAVLQSARLLTEFDIGPDDLGHAAVDDPAQRERRDRLIDCLRHLRDQDTGFAQMHSLHRGEFPPQDRLAQIVGPLGSTVVLHGFYFVSGPQMALLARLRDLGYRLVFIVFSSRRPREREGFRVWERFFGVHGEGLLPARERWQWEDEAPLPDPALTLLRALQGGQRVTLPDGLQVVGYADVNRLLAAHQQGPPGIIHAPDDDALGQSLAVFDPDAPPELRHIFRYPVGRLLLYLHSAWGPFAGEPELTPDQVAECLASGLLRTEDGRNGRSLLQAFGRLQPYVRNCRRADEWRRRMQDLQQVLKITDSDPPNDPWRRLRDLVADQPGVAGIRKGHPLQYLSQFSISSDDADALQDLVEQLFHYAEQLFGQSERSLRDHVEHLTQLLSIDPAEDELRREEQELCRKLVASLTEDAGALGNIRLLPWELIDAVSLFLADVTADEDGGAQGTVRRFEDLDAVPYDPDAEGLLRLTLLNEQFLPAAERGLPWPLDHLWLEACPAPGASLLRNFRTCLGESQLFLLVSALTSGHPVELSWIRHWQDEEQGPSPYLQLLSEEVMATSRDGLASEIRAWLREPENDGPEMEPDAAEQRVRGLREAELAEAAVCARRFHYSVVCGTGVHFDDPFHQNFILGNYLALLKLRDKDSVRYERLRSDDPGLAPFRSWGELEFLREAETKWGISLKANPHDATLPRALWQFQLLARNRKSRPIGPLQQARTLITGEPDDPQSRNSGLTPEQFRALGEQVRVRIRGWLQNPTAVPEASPGDVCLFCPWRGFCPDRDPDEDPGGTLPGKAEGAEASPRRDFAPSDPGPACDPPEEAVFPTWVPPRDIPSPGPFRTIPELQFLPESLAWDPQLELRFNSMNDYWHCRDWLDYLSFVSERHLDSS